MSDSPTILWVEDDASFRHAVTRALEVGGFRVIAAPDTMSALKELDRAPRVDLLLADIQMPPGQPHGLALARMARVRQPELPVIFLTGYEDLAGAAHQEIEAERRRRPDDPGCQIADEKETVEGQRRDDEQRDDGCDEAAVEGQGPELALAAVGRVTDAGAAVKHHTLSICSRPNRP